MAPSTSKQTSMHEDIIAFVRSLYPHQDTIPLHEPVLGLAETKTITECLQSTFVSSVGPTISDFEQQLCAFTGAGFAVAMVNGTACLHMAMLTAGVKPGMEVITQAATFIATANAISYCGAEPVFVDIDEETLGLCPRALENWLRSNTQVENKRCINRNTGREIKACVCMHTFGHPAKLEQIKKVCDEFQLALIEDSAEALGSFYNGRSVGTFGCAGILSFNGNKVITTGGGGALLTNSPVIAERARHLATTAKVNHPWESCHDQVAFNYRMPALNAALGKAQMLRLPDLLTTKQKIARDYANFFADLPYQWVDEPQHCQSNFWLNSVLCQNQQDKNTLLQLAANNHVQMRPMWQPLSNSKPYLHCQKGDLDVTNDIAERLINLPSSPKGSVHAVNQ